jgi:hypothetical protein
VRSRTSDLRNLLDQAEAVIEQGIDETRAWLASEDGRRFRAIAARALVLAAPLIVRHPFFRTPVGRLVQVAGGATLIVKIAEMIRDWEPTVRRSDTYPAAVVSR